MPENSAPFRSGWVEGEAQERLDTVGLAQIQMTSLQAILAQQGKARIPNKPVGKGFRKVTHYLIISLFLWLMRYSKCLVALRLMEF